MGGLGGTARAGLGAFGGLLPGLSESIAFAVELDDFGAVDKAVDEGDDAGGAGEHVGPFGEGFVGGDEHGQVEVSAGDDLEEEVGVAVVVVEVSDLVDGEELGCGEASLLFLAFSRWIVTRFGRVIPLTNCLG